MIANRIAVQLQSLAQPFKKALHTAAAMQADGVQIDARSDLKPSDISDTGLRQLRKVLDDLNLTISSIAFPTRRGYADRDDLDRRVEAALAAMRFAARLQTRTLIVTLGALHNEEEGAAMRDVLAIFSPASEKHGVQIAADARAIDLQALGSLLADFPASSLGVDFNPGALILHGTSPDDYLAQVGERIAHVHATDAVRGVGAPGASVELGRGTADIPALLGQLEEHNYRGWLTVGRRDSQHPVEECSNAVQFLRAL